MERVRPQCRNAAEAHDSHGFHTPGYTSWQQCRGWTGAEADTTALMDVLDGYVRDRWPLPVEDGIRLECHPYVPAMLTRMSLPDFSEFRAGQHAVVDPQIPVVAVAGMECGQWRLARDGDAPDVAAGVIRSG